MASLFRRIRTGLSRNKYFVDIALNPDSIATTDDMLAKEIEGYEYDETKIDTFRKEHAKNILALRDKVDESYVKDYEGQVKRQIMDLSNIITLSHKIISNEYLSITYDVRRPMMLLSEYENKLSSVLNKVQIDSKKPEDVKKTQDIKSTLLAIKKEYAGIMANIIELCKRFKEAGNPANKDIDIAASVAKRAQIKRKLSGRTLVLVNHVSRLEKDFAHLAKKKLLTDDEYKSIKDNITQFKEHFKLLTDLTVSRAKASEAVIEETLLLQKRKIEEFSRLEKELKEIAPSLKKKDQDVINNCYYIIDAEVRQEVKDIAEEKKEEEMATSAILQDGLVSDDSIIHSQGPASVEPKTNTVLGWFRKKFFAWTMIGTMAFNQGASTYSGINAARLAKLSPVEITHVVDSAKKFPKATYFEFSTHYDNKEGPAVSDTAATREIVRNIIDASKAIEKDANEKYGSAPGTTLIDCRNILIGAGGTDLFGDHDLNIALGKERQKYTIERLKESLADLQTKDHSIKVANIDSIQVAQNWGINFDRNETDSVVTLLNNELIKMRNLGKITSDQEYAAFSDAKKIRSGDEAERIKFFEACKKYLRDSNDKRLNELYKHIKDVMMPMRNVPVLLVVNGQVILVGTIIMPPPAVDTVKRDVQGPFAQKSKNQRYVPLDTTKNYKGQGYVQTKNGYTSRLGVGGNVHFKNNRRM